MGTDSSRMVPLAALITERVTQLLNEGDTRQAIAERAGWSSTTSLVKMMSRTQPYQIPPPDDRLKALATALRLPLAELRRAAVESVEQPQQTPATSFGQLIRNARLEQGWSMDRTIAEAKRLGYRITKSNLWNLETGEHLPKPETVEALTHTLRLSSKAAREALEASSEGKALVLPARLARKIGPHNERAVIALIEAYLDSDR